MLWIKKRVLLHKSFDLDLRHNFSFKHADKHLINALCNYLELESHQDFFVKASHKSAICTQNQRL